MGASGYRAPVRQQPCLVNLKAKMLPSLLTMNDLGNAIPLSKSERNEPLAGELQNVCKVRFHFSLTLLMFVC